MSLTDDDRFLIAEARRIAAALRVRASDAERLAAEVTARLADRLERLGVECGNDEDRPAP